MKVTISIQGKMEVLKELNNITEKNIQKLNNDIKNAVIYCMGGAKRNVSRPYPQGAVDTGQLMNSITHRRKNRRKSDKLFNRNKCKLCSLC